MYTMYLLAISSARRSIYLTNPYFLPDDRFDRALLAAVARGVRVVVLTPGKIDHNPVRSAGRRGFGPHRASLLHAKTMVVDGTWATIGSTNFDHRSFALNEELNIAVYDASVAARLARIFEDDLGRARRVTYEAWKNRGLGTKLFELFVAPLQSQLEPHQRWLLRASSSMRRQISST